MKVLFVAAVVLSLLAVTSCQLDRLSADDIVCIADLCERNSVVIEANCPASTEILDNFASICRSSICSCILGQIYKDCGRSDIAGIVDNTCSAPSGDYTRPECGGLYKSNGSVKVYAFPTLMVTLIATALSLSL